MVKFYGLKGEGYPNEESLRAHYRPIIEELLEIYDGLVTDIPDDPDTLESFRASIDYLAGNTCNEDLEPAGTIPPLWTDEQ